FSLLSQLHGVLLSLHVTFSGFSLVLVGHKRLILLFKCTPMFAGVNTSCPLELSPPRVVVKYGDPVTISCMTWKRDHDGMGWEAPQGGKSISNVTSSNWTVDSLTEWDMSPICFFASHYKGCTITPGLVLYKTISIRSSGDLKEGEETVFTCDIVDVAPLQNLSVTWFKGDTIIHRETFNDSTKEPVSQSSILQFTPTREDSGSTITCEARLDLGPVGPDLKVSSEEYAVTVFYVPCTVVEITEGQTIEEKCAVTGNPAPKVRWFQDGELINSSVPFGRKDAGRYAVEAEGHTPLNKTITFIVLCECHPPASQFITRPGYTLLKRLYVFLPSDGPELECPSTYTVLEHDDRNLACTVEGYPTPEIIWYKDGEEVELPETFTRRDAGQYVITASNSLTSVNSTVDIVVLCKS
uniref:Ig-like domain-containing protein n=1 Tax=Salarias fasciatus TaxID=181472 RepID=A0A672IYR6_SALFA